MSLDCLGLTQFEELVYRTLLRQGEDNAGSKQKELRAAVARLAELELVRIGPDGQPVAVAAEADVTRLIRRRMQEANAELRRLAGARETVHSLDAVATLVDLFDRVWVQGNDPEPAESRELADRERQVLRLLATAVKDEVSAREMGVSLRTFRRYVAELFARLGAANRFQAAVIAKQRGWI
jgi:DNA-binding NarL/FixJ family response regulator